MLIEKRHYHDPNDNLLEPLVRDVLNQLPITFNQQPLDRGYGSVTRDPEKKITTAQRLRNLAQTAYYIHCFGHLALGHVTEEPLLENFIGTRIPKTLLHREIETEAWVSSILKDLLNGSIDTDALDIDMYSWHLEEDPDTIKYIFKDLAAIFTQKRFQPQARKLIFWANHRYYMRQQQLKDLYDTTMSNDPSQENLTRGTSRFQFNTNHPLFRFNN